jgi:ABC-type sugar transport system ATPase subunit
VRLDEGGGIVPLINSLATAASSAPDGVVILGIRPESISILPQQEPGALATTVYAVEPQGDRFIYDLQVGGAVIKVKTSPDLILAYGQPAWSRFDPAEIHLFDATGQRRIEAPAHG